MDVGKSWFDHMRLVIRQLAMSMKDSGPGQVWIKCFEQSLTFRSAGLVGFNSKVLVLDITHIIVSCIKQKGNSININPYWDLNV